MSQTPTRIPFDPKSVLTVVSTSALSIQNAVEGILVPLVIVDTTDHIDIEENIRMHQHVMSGDVSVSWGTSEGKIALLLDFASPIVTNATILFKLPASAFFVDAIVRSGALYLQAGSPGDLLSSTLDAPRILLEIGNTGFAKVWEGTYRATIAQSLRDRGLSKKAAKVAAVEVIANLRHFASIRL